MCSRRGSPDSEVLVEVGRLRDAEVVLARLDALLRAVGRLLEKRADRRGESAVFSATGVFRARGFLRVAGLRASLRCGFLVRLPLSSSQTPLGFCASSPLLGGASSSLLLRAAEPFGFFMSRLPCASRRRRAARAQLLPLRSRRAHEQITSSSFFTEEDPTVRATSPQP